MKTYIAAGNTLTITAAADIASGEGVLVGALFGVAVTDIATGEAGEIALTGVFELPKAPSQAWSLGAKVYWDDTARQCTTAATGNTLIGAAVRAVGGGASETTGTVRLNGTA
jgi:predicted RecA/RadA family phage recombinase